jgi:hypothetical protein
MARAQRSCDLLIPNEFAETLLCAKQRKEVDDANRSLTDTVTKQVCPTVSLPSVSITVQTLLTDGAEKANGSESANEKTCLVLVQKRNKCANSLSPTNTALYGSTICQQLSGLEGFGLTRSCIRKLGETYRVVWPWSLNYGSVSVGNNKRTNFFPSIVTFPETVSEVQKWIRLAAKLEIPVSVRSGGHSYEGFSAYNTLVLDMSFLRLPCKRKQVRICKKRLTVDVTPGVRLGPLYAKLESSGLQMAGGICPSVCVGGLLLGGGVGFFIRDHGYACDSLLEADVVLANGSLVTATATNGQANLFRALKGAGWAGFGAITRYRIQLYPAQPLVSFLYAFALSDSVPVLQQLQVLSTSAPNNLSMTANFSPGVPSLILNGVYRPNNKSDPINEFLGVIGPQLLTPLLPIIPVAQLVEVASWTDIDTALGFEAPSIPFYKNRSSYVFAALTTSAMTNILASFATPPLPSNNGQMLFAFQWLVLGGRVAEIDPLSSVMVARAGYKAWVQLGMYWSDPNDQASAFQYVNNVYNSCIANGMSTNADPNVPDRSLSNYATSYWGSAVSFLTAARQIVDPNGLFSFPQAVPL